MIVLALLFFKHLSFLALGFPDINDYLLSILNDITAVLFVSCMDYQTFSKYYSKLLLVICCVTCCAWVLVLLNIPIFSIFPVLTNSHGVSAYFCGLTNIWANTDYFVSRRMMGIFWEPGVFQIFITIAFIFDLYGNYDRKVLIKRLLIYTVTIVAAFSTTGFLSILFAWTLYFTKLGKFPVFYLGVFIAGVFYLATYLYATLDESMAWTVFGKLENTQEIMNGTSEGDGSTYTRVSSIVYPLEKFSESPVFGIGESGKAAISKRVGHGMLTCTVINYLTFYGLFCALLCFVGFIKLLNLRNKTFLERFTLIVLVVVCTMSEAMAFNPVFTILMLYGYLRKEQLQKSLLIKRTIQC